MLSVADSQIVISGSTCTYEVFDGNTLFFRCNNSKYDTFSMCKHHIKLCEPCPIIQPDDQEMQSAAGIPKTVAKKKKQVLSESTLVEKVRVRCAHTYAKGEKTGQQCEIMCDASFGWCYKHKKGKNPVCQPILAQAQRDEIQPAPEDSQETVDDTNPLNLIPAMIHEAPKGDIQQLLQTTDLNRLKNAEWTNEEQEWTEDDYHEVERDDFIKIWGNTYNEHIDVVNVDFKISSDDKLPSAEEVEAMNKAFKNKSKKCSPKPEPIKRQQCTHIRKRKNTDPEDVDLRCTCSTKVEIVECVEVILCCRHRPKVKKTVDP